MIATVILAVTLAYSGLAIAAEEEEYIISPRDHIKITVMNHEDLSGTYVPLSDNSFEYPLLGTIYAPGKTIQQFTHEMEERLTEFIINPKVIINITEMGGTRIYIFGQVPNQGAFSLGNRNRRVLDALAASGGFGSKTAKKHIFLIRKGNEQNIQILNINRFLKTGDLTQNPVLNEGDCLYLTSNHKLSVQSIFSFITGAIATWNNVDEIKER